MLIDIIKVYTDNREAIYFNGIHKLEDDGIHVDDVLRRLKGDTVCSFRTYYVQPDIFALNYKDEFPYEFNEISIIDLI